MRPLLVVLALALALALAGAAGAQKDKDKPKEERPAGGGSGGGSGGGGGEAPRERSAGNGAPPPHSTAGGNTAPPPGQGGTPPGQDEARSRGEKEPGASEANESSPTEPEGGAEASPKEGKGKGRERDDERERPQEERRAERKEEKEERKAQQEARKAAARGGPSGGRGEARGGGGAGGAGGGGVAVAAGLERASLEEAGGRTAEERAVVRVVRAGTPVEVAQGAVEVAPERAPPLADLVLVHPDGTEERMGTAGAPASWNTTSYANGYYTVEVRESRGDGNATIASARVLVANPRATALEAAAAVATGAVVAAGAGAVAGRGIDLLAFAKQSLFEIGGELAEDRAQRKTAWGRSRATRSVLLIGLAGLFLAVFKVAADRAEFAEALSALPLALVAVFLCTLATYAAEWQLARQSGTRARFQFWLPGALSLALSALVFRSAFGYPGYVDEEEGAVPQRKRAAVRAVALIAAGFAIAVPFLVLGTLWRWELAEYGVGVALMMAAASSLPFSPMPGRDVWAWRRLAWLPVFLVAAAAYVLWETALVGTSWLVALGLGGLAVFALLSAWLGSRAREAARDAATSR